MKQVVLNIPDKYASVLTVTCVGLIDAMTNVTVQAFDIRNVEEHTPLNVLDKGTATKPVNNAPVAHSNAL